MQRTTLRTARAGRDHGIASCAGPWPPATRSMVAAAIAAVLAAPAGAPRADACGAGTTTITGTAEETCALGDAGADDAVVVTETGVIRDGEAVLVRGNPADRITNAGTMEGDFSGVLVDQDGALSGGIETQGTIRGGIQGIAIDDRAVVDGALQNTGTITGGEPSGSVGYGVHVTRGADLAGGIVNRGTISGVTVDGAEGVGVRIRSGGRVSGGIMNRGTISGTRYAVQIDGGEGGLPEALAEPAIEPEPALPFLRIEGDDARFIGDVFAPDTPVTVASGATFTNDNAFFVDAFTVEEGALFNFRPGPASFGPPRVRVLAADSTSSPSGVFVRQGFRNDGAVAIAAGDRPVITGSYTQGEAGVLRTEVAGDDSYGQLEVTGTATLPSAARIDVDVATTQLSAPGRLEDLLTAGELVSDGTFEVTDDSFLFSFEAVLDASTVDLVVARDASVEESTRQEGNTQAVDAGRVLDEIIEAGGGDEGSPFEEAVQALGELGSREEISRAASQTLPLLVSNGNFAVNQSLAGTHRAVEQRLAGGQGLAAGDPMLSDRHLWVKPFGSWVEQDDKGGVTGYDGDSRGVILGADAMTAAGMRVGAALAYSTSEVDANPGGARHDADIDTWQLAGYGSRSLDPRTEVRFQAGLAWSEVEGERTIAFMPGAPVARSDYDNWSVHLGGALGRTYQHGERTTLEPSLRADYTRIESDDYTETGAGALNLDVDSETVEELIVALEGRLDQDLTPDTSLEARAGIGYDVIDDDASLTASFVGGGASFVTPGIDRDPWVGRLGVGLEHRTDQGMQISARYDLEAREDFDNQTASIKVRWRF